MRLDRLHDWDVTPREAVAIQQDLRRRIVADMPLDLSAIRSVAGVDVSVKDGHSHAAIVVATFPDFAVLETATARAPTPFPYVPGLLSFREGPVLEAALAQLRHEPDVFVFDGMGIAHPRRIGIASHMGLWLDRPTVGCGKTLLVGRHETLPEERGASRPLTDRGEVIGAAVRTRTAKNPVYISPGHRADVDSAVALVLACAPRFRLPEPIRLAHKAAGLFTP